MYFWVFFWCSIIVCSMGNNKISKYSETTKIVEVSKIQSISMQKYLEISENVNHDISEGSAGVSTLSTLSHKTEEIYC